MTDDEITEGMISAHLGLSRLRVGSRRTGRRPVDENWQVLAWWTVTVEPSFHPPVAVGAVHEEYWTAGSHPDRVAVRGFVVGVTGAAVAALDTDPIPEALGRMNPFGVMPTHRVLWSGLGADRRSRDEFWGEVATADGLGYVVQWETQAVEGGQFRFANPPAGWPLEFERLVYQFARTVTLAGSVGELEDALICWRGYREGIDAHAG